MREIFKCDCGTHLVSIEYLIPDKVFDWDDLAIAIYDVYNPETGRKYKVPKLVSDVVILNNNSPKELTKLIKFLQKILDTRKTSKRKNIYHGTPSIMRGLDKKIKNLKKKEAKDLKEDNDKMRKKKIK